MKQLQVQSDVVILEGLSLRGSISLYNPNADLAIVYEVTIKTDQCSQKTQSQGRAISNNKRIQIFPNNGILLKKQHQKITIWLKNYDHISSSQNDGSQYQLVIKYHYYHQYNKLLIKTTHLKSVDPIQLFSFQGSINIPIRIGAHHSKIKGQIDNQIMLESTLGRETANISKISMHQFEWQEQQQEMGSIINSLQINSKKSSPKRSLEMESIRSRTQFSGELGGKKDRRSSVQLILLAILAAFFFSLGANLNFILNK